jgi:hypothetical protein
MMNMAEKQEVYRRLTRLALHYLRVSHDFLRPWQLRGRDSVTLVSTSASSTDLQKQHCCKTHTNFWRPSTEDPFEDRAELALFSRKICVD